MTKLERYNDENYNNREKAKNTWLQIYGVNHPKKTLEVNEKNEKHVYGKIWC